MSGDFSPEQKRYLEGFPCPGLQIARAPRIRPRREGKGLRSCAAEKPTGP